MQPSLTRPFPDERLSKHHSLTQHRVHSPYEEQLYDDLLHEWQTCRQGTLALVDGISPEMLSQQAHSEFSPIGWHLGHIAYTEALWMLEDAQTSDRYQTLFAADGLPKAERQNLPTLAELLDYLQTVRSQTVAKIKQVQLRLLFWLLQHEGQHAETMAMVMAMHEQNARSLLSKLSDVSDSGNQEEMVFIGCGTFQQGISQQGISQQGISQQGISQQGTFQQGADAPWAIDNEMPPHRTRVNSFYIDKRPVTCAQFAQFIDAGGYSLRKWWSAEGWAWQQQAQVQRPLHWSDDPMLGSKPVCGVSWYEAEAYARSQGKRLPTESEWEKAAIDGRCEGMFGGVWEWTNTWFDSYAGFQPFPYAGYSQVYFDGEHRVLKGGSWASPSAIIRRSFRNWYHPHRRELFAGFRCAR